MDDLYDRAREKLRHAVHRKEVKAAAAGSLIGFAIGELGHGRVREDLGFKGTKETARIEALAQRAARIADRKTGAILTGAAFLTGRPEALAGTLGLTAGLAAAEVHRDAPPLDLKGGLSFLEPRAPNHGDLLQRAWKAERIDIDERMSNDEKFKILGDLINKLAVEGAYDPVVRRASDEACQFVDGTIQSYAEAVGDWVVQNIQYLRDEDMAEYIRSGEVVPDTWGSLEVFQSAGRTIESGYGDCDCRSILVAAMLRAQKVLSHFRMISQDDPEEYTHIYNVVPLENGTEFSVDTTPTKTPFGYVYYEMGWEAKRVSSLTVLAQPLAGHR